MKTSVCLAAVIAVVVIQMVNAIDIIRPEVKKGIRPRKITTDTTPSDSTTVATPTCEEVMCMDGCEQVLGPDGCPFCDCQTNCSNMNCTKDEECILEPIECKRDPCFPRPTCVPRKSNVACTGTPNTSLCTDFVETKWFFNASAHSCQSFSYYDCTPSPNTFPSREACMDKCKSANVCGICDADCYRLQKTGQVTKCICPNPCKDFNCTEGEVCRLVDVVCANPSCNATQEPSCVKNPCPEPETCGIRCMKSFKMDDNGCQLCECCDQYAPGWIGPINA